MTIFMDLECVAQVSYVCHDQTYLIPLTGVGGGCCCCWIGGFVGVVDMKSLCTSNKRLATLGGR